MDPMVGCSRLPETVRSSGNISIRNIPAQTGRTLSTVPIGCPTTGFRNSNGQKKRPSRHHRRRISGCRKKLDLESKDVSLPSFPSAPGKQVRESERVVIWEYVPAPGAATSLHHHGRDAVVVAFKELKAHVTFVARGVTHKDEQTAGADRAYVFELK